MLRAQYGLRDRKETLTLRVKPFTLGNGQNASEPENLIRFNDDTVQTHCVATGLVSIAKRKTPACPQRPPRLLVSMREAVGETDGHTHIHTH